MASGDAKPFPRKNVAYRVTFPILDADGDLVPAAGSLDSEISKDGGTFADCTNEATEIATSSGMYYLDLTATEMNADTVAIIVKSTSGKTTPIVLYPEEAGDIRVNLTQCNGNTVAAGAIPNAAAAASGGLPTVDGSNHIAGVQGTINNLNNLDAAITTRSSHSAGDVWAVDATTQQTQGTFGQAIGDPGADADTIWGLANTNLDAAVSSRSSHSAADVADAVWDEASTGHVDAGKAGAQLWTDIDDILTDTDAIQQKLPSKAYLSGSADADGGIDATEVDVIGDEVNLEVQDVINTDTVSELTSVPAVGAPLRQMIQWIFEMARNERETTSSADTVFKDDTTTQLGQSTINDNGSTFTRGEYS